MKTIGFTCNELRPISERMRLTPRMMLFVIQFSFGSV